METTYQAEMRALGQAVLDGRGVSTVPADGARYSDFDRLEAWGESQGREVLVEVGQDVTLEGPVEVEVRRVWNGSLETFGVVTSTGPLDLTGVEGNRYFVTGAGR